LNVCANVGSPRRSSVGNYQIRHLKRRSFRRDAESPSSPRRVCDRTGITPETRTRRAGRARYPD